MCVFVDLLYLLWCFLTVTDLILSFHAGVGDVNRPVPVSKVLSLFNRQALSDVTPRVLYQQALNDVTPRSSAQNLLSAVASDTSVGSLTSHGQPV